MNWNQKIVYKKTESFSDETENLFQNSLGRYLLFYSEILSPSGQKTLNELVLTPQSPFKFYVVDLLQRFEFEFKKLSGKSLKKMCNRYLNILVQEKVFSAGWAELYTDEKHKELVALVVNYLRMSKLLGERGAKKFLWKSLKKGFKKYDPTGRDMLEKVERIGFLIISVLEGRYFKEVSSRLTEEDFLKKVSEWFTNKKNYLEFLALIKIENISDIIFMPLLNEFIEKNVIGFITGLNRKKDIEEKLKKMLAAHFLNWETLPSSRKKEYIEMFHQVNKEIIFPIANHFLKIHVHAQTIDKERLEDRPHVEPALIVDGKGIVQIATSKALKMLGFSREPYKLYGRSFNTLLATEEDLLLEDFSKIKQKAAEHYHKKNSNVFSRNIIIKGKSGHPLEIKINLEPYGKKINWSKKEPLLNQPFIVYLFDSQTAHRDEINEVLGHESLNQNDHSPQLFFHLDGKVHLGSFLWIEKHFHVSEEDIRSQKYEIQITDQNHQLISMLTLRDLVLQNKDYLHKAYFEISLKNHEYQSPRVGISGQIKFLAGRKPGFYRYYLSGKEVKAENEDSMTGAKNRRFLEETFFPYFLHTHLEQKKPYAFFIFDLDHFKKINDTFGHPEGDRVIQQFSKLTQDYLKGSQLLHCFARVGGEEFILAISMENRNIQELSDELHQFIKMKNPNGEPITFSAGALLVNSFPNNLMSYEDHAAMVDHLLYQAKNSGRNKTIISKNPAFQIVSEVLKGEKPVQGPSKDRKD